MKVFALAMLLLFTLSACATTPEPVEKAPEPIVCPEDSKTCSDGTVLKRVAPGCEFEKCPDVSRVFCQPDQRNVECPETNQPVCARIYNSECTGDSCARVSSATVSNHCFACANENVLYYVKGACPK